jgi:SAM-dependent methyltransferase
MARTATASGSAERWGPLWGARPEDWAATEEQQIPAYEESIHRLGIKSGQRVLDLGCGSGVFLRLAADRGAEVFGLDASEALIRLARARVPEADLRVGDIQFLPYDEDSFDLVSGFTSFFFAADMLAALRESGRVAKPEAPIVIQVWGDPERCDLEAMKAIARPFMSPRPPDAPLPPELWKPGVLESMASEAGLEPQTTFDVSWAYEYPDEDALGRAMMAPGGLAELVGPSREADVRSQIVEALAAHRTAAGGYRLENEFHFLVARAGPAQR